MNLLYPQPLRAECSGPLYSTRLKAGQHTLLADEPVVKGGGNTGPDPFALLLLSLGSCTAITLRMYAELKNWDLQAATCYLNLVQGKAGTDEASIIMNRVEVMGELNDAQMERLHIIATRCPIHKALSPAYRIDTTLQLIIPQT